MEAYTKEETYDAYYLFLMKYLSGDALLWILAYGIYVHSIDDIIDQDIPGNERREQFLLKTFEFAEVVYSNHFYINNVHHLRPLIKMASNTYMDSIILERSTDVIKKKISDSLRSTGNEVILAVIEIVGGIDKRREASLELREISYKVHHDKLGNAI